MTRALDVAILVRGVVAAVLLQLGSQEIPREIHSEKAHTHPGHGLRPD